jgi:hypothetical protein
MTEAGLKKLEQPDFNRLSPFRVAGTRGRRRRSDPAAYWVPQAPKLDRQTLLSELKHGGEIPVHNVPTPNLCSV